MKCQRCGRQKAYKGHLPPEEIARLDGYVQYILRTTWGQHDFIPDPVEAALDEALDLLGEVVLHLPGPETTSVYKQGGRDLRAKIDAYLNRVSPLLKEE